MDEQTARERVARVEELLSEFEERGETAAIEAVGALLELYGEGLARIVQQVGDGVAETLVADDLVAHLLLLHDLHPVDLETRVTTALDEVRPYLSSHGGGVELVGIDEGIVRLRLQGSCDGCPSSATTLKLAVEDAIYKAAPDIDGIEAEGGVGADGNGLSITMVGGDAASEQEPPPSIPPGAQALPLAGEQRPIDSAENGNRWKMAGSLPQLSGGGTVLKWIGGDPVLFMGLDGSFFAYRHLCPSCTGSLEDAALEGSELECRSCGMRYDIRRAGRCLDSPQLHLEPLPLLVADTGLVKVAVGS